MLICIGGKVSSDDKCYSYWEKHFKKLITSLDDSLLYKQLLLYAHRECW